MHNEFVVKLGRRVDAIKVGHPLSPETEIGPLIHHTHLQKVASYFSIAQEEGAKITAGGRILGGEGFYVVPTLLINVRHNMRCAREEISGPVLSVIPFADEAEVLELANDVSYGLTGYVWTNDVTRALRFINRLEAGMIWLNSENVRHLPTPFGEMKASGIGRDGGDYSFDYYMETKNIAFATGTHRVSRLGALD